MVKGDLREAKQDFEKALDHNVWDQRTVIWLHLVRARLGESPRNETERHARRFDKGKWPGPALAALMGEISIESMIAAAREPSAIKTREQEAEAYFVAGEYYLAVKRAADARRMFEEVLKRNAPQLSVQAGAKAELRNLPK
jgi:lipoprotein NlpI